MGSKGDDLDPLSWLGSTWGMHLTAVTGSRRLVIFFGKKNTNFKEFSSYFY